MSLDGNSVTSASGCLTVSTTAVTTDPSTKSPATVQRTNAATEDRAATGRASSLTADTVPDAIPLGRVRPNRTPGRRSQVIMTRWPSVLPAAA